MLPNCAVHVVMYMYYLCACLGSKVQKMIIPWKKYITRLQLVRKYPGEGCFRSSKNDSASYILVTIGFKESSALGRTYVRKTVCFTWHVHTRGLHCGYSAFITR